MADKKKMSVAEILAAARKSDAGGGMAAAEPGPEPAPASPDSSPPASPPAASASPPKAAAKPGAMSVADILAAARAQKAGGQPAQSEAAPPRPDPKPAPKPAAEKAPAEKASLAKPAGPKDTASVLAAARKGAKPGPMSKAEAAAKSEPVKSEKKKIEAPPMPEKPAYARPVAVAQVSDRRSFLSSFSGVLVGSSLAIGFSSLAVTQILWGLGLARFMFPNILTEPPTRFKVGFPDILGPGQVETKYIPQYGVWVVRDEYDGVPQIYAIQAVCTHLGCTPNWLEAEQKFKCPCHGSGFYKTGINFEGPAPRPLERFAIRLADDGQLEVDKSRKFQEELGQWKDPASFVPV